MYPMHLPFGTGSVALGISDVRGHGQAVSVDHMTELS